MNIAYSKLYWESGRVDEFSGEYEEGTAHHICYVLSWEVYDLETGDLIETEFLFHTIDPADITTNQWGKTRNRHAQRWFLHRQCEELVKRAGKLRR